MQETRSIVVVIIKVNHHPSVEQFLPPNNWIGTTLLADLLAAKMQEAGCQPQLIGYSGPLNDLVVSFSVSNRLAALSAVKTTLESRFLLVYFRIYYLCESEGVLRSFLNPGEVLFLNDYLTEINRRTPDILAFLEKNIALVQPPTKPE